MEVFQPLPSDGILQTKGKVIDVMDKKSGAVVVTECKLRIVSFYFWIVQIICFSTGDTFNQSGELLFRNQSSTFIVGAGNFNGNKTASDQVVSSIAVPSRIADSTIQYKTSVDQAAIYRFIQPY